VRAPVLLALYVLSGAAALLYEVAWLRLLGLNLGHTVAAVSTVLTAFMGGLAAGAAIAGRRAGSMTAGEALRLCAICEAAVALSALLVPFAIQSATPLLASAYANGDGTTLFGFVRVLIALAALAIPTMAMGATYPLVVKALPNAGGAAYAANTFGAALGVSLAGFVLLPAVGLRATMLVAVVLNLVAAAGFWLSARRLRAEPAPVHTQNSAFSSDQSSASAPVLLAIGLSGFIGLASEVAWTRVLAMIVGPTTYAFSGMLVTFIVGIAIGSTVGTFAARRLHSDASLKVALAVTFVVAAAGAALAVAVAGRGPLLVGRWVARPDASFGWIVAAELGVAAALLLPITLALGAAFPIALAARATTAAQVYVANTIGAIGGSLAGGWLFVPLLGLRGTILTLAAVGSVAAAGLAVSAGRLRRQSIVTAGAAAGVIAALFVLPRWDPELMSGGAYKYAPYLRGGDLETGLLSGELLYYKEGASGTVTVRRTAASTALAIDGKVDASNDADMLTQRLLAHLPLVLHPAPRQVAIIGLGSGVTAGSALTHDVARVDVLEISPQVVEASGYFTRENNEPLRDARLNLIVGDGRSHLKLGSSQYDVIVSEPSNPWMAGVANLFTREFFEAAKARLSSNGLLCQWAHTYDISAADLKSIAATFVSVFPDSQMWLVGEGDLLLIGGPDGVSPELDRVTSALARPRVRRDLEQVRVRSAFGLLSLFAGDGDALREFSAGAVVQADDLLALEFSAPRAIFGRSSDVNARDLRQRAASARRPPAVAQAFAAATAADWRDRGRMLAAADAHHAAFEDLTHAARLDPRDRETLEELARTAARTQQLHVVDRMFEDFVAKDLGNAAARLERSRLAAARGDYALARQLAVEAGKLDPRSQAALEQLASVVADEEDAEALAVVVGGLQQGAPGSASTLYYAASLEFLKGNPHRAAELAAQAAALRPGDARVHNLAGAANGALGRVDRARASFRAAVEASPDDPVAYVNLGTLELQGGNPAAAGRYFMDALALEPSSVPAREGLARSLEILGQADRAAAVRRGS
jgi:spermidine synthase